MYLIIILNNLTYYNTVRRDYISHTCKNQGNEYDEITTQNNFLITLITRKKEKRPISV